MQKWQIEGRVQWLCDDCAKKNAHVFILCAHEWLGEHSDASVVCDCCRCPEVLVQKMGKWRWLLYPFISLLIRPWLVPAKVARRVK